MRSPLELQDDARHGQGFLIRAHDEHMRFKPLTCLLAQRGIVWRRRRHRIIEQPSLKQRPARAITVRFNAQHPVSATAAGARSSCTIQMHSTLFFCYAIVNSLRSAFEEHQIIGPVSYRCTRHVLPEMTWRPRTSSACVTMSRGTSRKRKNSSSRRSELGYCK